MIRSTTRAQRERHPPRLAALVGDRQREHREREPEPAREPEHRGRERARAFGRLFDRGDRGDGERRVDERARQDLQRGERREARRERRQRGW